MQIGCNYFFKIKSFDRRISDIVSGVSDSFNIASRFEKASKMVSKKRDEYVPLSIPFEIVEAIPENIQLIFKNVFCKYIMDDIQFHEEELITAYSGFYEKIQRFYKGNKDRYF